MDFLILILAFSLEIQKSSLTSLWNKMRKNQQMAENIGDNQALFLHYKNMHPDATTQDLELSQTFRVIFIEKPPVKMLDVREDF